MRVTLAMISFEVRFPDVFLTFAHRRELVVETGVEASPTRRSNQEATHVAAVLHRRPDFVYVAEGAGRRGDHHHRGIRWLFGSAAGLWFCEGKIIFIILLINERTIIRQ